MAKKRRKKTRARRADGRFKKASHHKTKKRSNPSSPPRRRGRRRKAARVSRRRSGRVVVVAANPSRRRSGRRRVSRRRRNPGHWLGLLFGIGVGAAALGVAQVAAAHGLVPDTIQKSPVKNGLLLTVGGAAAGGLVSYVSPAIGAGLGIGLGAFGLYMTGEGLINPPPSAKKTAPAQGVTPSTPQDNTLQSIGPVSQMPADQANSVFGTGWDAPMLPIDTTTADNSDTSPNALDGSSFDPSMIGLGRVYDPRQLAAVYNARKIGAVYDPRRMGAVVYRGFQR